MPIFAQTDTRYKTLEGDSFLCTDIITSDGRSLAILLDTQDNTYDFRQVTAEGYFVELGVDSDIGGFYNEKDAPSETEPMTWFSGSHLLRINDGREISYLSFKSKEGLQGFLPPVDERRSGCSFHVVDIDSVHSMVWREV